MNCNHNCSQVLGTTARNWRSLSPESGTQGYEDAARSHSRRSATAGPCRRPQLPVRPCEPLGTREHDPVYALRGRYPACQLRELTPARALRLLHYRQHAPQRAGLAGAAPELEGRRRCGSPRTLGLVSGELSVVLDSVAELTSQTPSADPGRAWPEGQRPAGPHERTGGRLPPLGLAQGVTTCDGRRCSTGSVGVPSFPGCRRRCRRRGAALPVAPA